MTRDFWNNLVACKNAVYYAVKGESFQLTDKVSTCWVISDFNIESARIESFFSIASTVNSWIASSSGVVLLAVQAANDVATKRSNL